MTTMLELMQQTTAELGVSSPASVAGNTTQDVIQLLALMNAVGYEMLSEFDWQKLTKIYNFSTEYTTTTGTYPASGRVITGIPSTSGLDTTYMVLGVGIANGAFIVSVDSASQVTISLDITIEATAGDIYFQKVKYALPNDYASMTPRTQWDKTKHWEALGPTDGQQWEWLMSGFIATGPRIRWRLLDGLFQIWPGFSSAEQLGFEYRSNAWADSASGAAKTSFTVDTDTCIYPDRLMVLGTKLKYFEAKGFDTTAMYRNWRSILESSKAQDQSAANLSLAPRPASILIGWDNIPDSGYGNT
jgi:hypothetical protein